MFICDRTHRPTIVAVGGVPATVAVNVEAEAVSVVAVVALVVESIVAVQIPLEVFPLVAVEGYEDEEEGGEGPEG